MTHIKVAVVCLTGLVLASTSSHAQSVAGSNKALESKRTELAGIMEKWAEHRSQKIVVLNIQGLSDGEASTDELDRLETRLKTLLNKTRSNREWKSYWSDEARLSGEVLRLYDELSPREGLGVLSSAAQRFAQEGKAAELKAKAKQDAVEKAAAAEKEVRKSVRVALNALETSLRELPEKVKILESQVDSLKGKIEDSRKALAKARNETDRERLGDAVSELDAQLQKAVSELETVSNAVKASEAAKTALERSIEGKEVVFEGVEQSLVSTIKSYQRTQAEAERLRSEQSKMQKEAADIKALSNTLALEHQRYGARRNALKRWKALAEKKVANQDTYYKAIQSDVEAVRDRLRSFRKTQEPDEVERSEDVCSRELGDEETSLQLHRECVASTKAEIETLQSTMEQRTEANKLTDRLLESTSSLLEAQRTDEELVQEEFGISSEESARAGSKEASETAEWSGLWKVYASKAKKKISSLSDAVISSKETQRALNVNRGLHESEISLLSEKIAALEEELAQRDSASKLIGSLLATAWELVRIGWPALIYLFLAWFVLRLTRRVSSGVISQAESADENDEAYVELQRALKDAERANELARVNDLRDQITIHESRRRDAAQRVTTLTNIAGGAVKVVVYIATSLLVLDALTVDVGPILGGAAIFGLAISFGSQSLVKDVVTGFFILLENQYAVGDVVTINGQSGGVERITLRRTVLRDVKGGVHNIPNGTISSVVNSTQGWARAVIHLGVAYGTDMEKVEAIVNRVGEEMYSDDAWNPKLMEAPSYVGITAFNDSDITFRAMFKTHTFENWGAEREFNRRIKVAFEQEGVEIPFPQQDVHIVSGNA